VGRLPHLHAVARAQPPIGVVAGSDRDEMTTGVRVFLRFASTPNRSMPMAWETYFFTQAQRECWSGCSSPLWCRPGSVCCLL
jgi:hypothetical protein